MPTRSPQEIRASIELNRQELGTSLEKLRREVVRVTDWRAQIRRHERLVGQPGRGSDATEDFDSGLVSLGLG